ncbi:hypothetical protein L1049_012225 [Liquidambar formosana]|uniref:Transcription factor bHLH51 n=1 Tax=Liquidambar formosana TaxID=63359 RepID=A0AAP0RYS4_LIQFO
MDKAALLGSVIDHVKDLKRKALDVSKVLTIPTEVDEVTVECEGDHHQDDACPSNNTSEKSKENIFIKASVCCDDRPELFVELIRALKGLRLTTVRADMASLGGRIKSILVLCTKDAEEGVSVSNIKQSLGVILSRIASSSAVPNYRITTMRESLAYTAGGGFKK